MTLARFEGELSVVDLPAGLEGRISVAIIAI
jgi:hypothetical protein